MKKYNDTHKYGDIINLPHHISPKRARMSRHDRAAQFSPFAALTGHDAAIKETSRLTEEKPEIDEYKKQELNEKLLMILENIQVYSVSITYFVADERKAGGTFVSAIGNVKKIDSYGQIVIMEDGTQIFIDDIVEIDLQACHN